MELVLYNNMNRPESRNKWKSCSDYSKDRLCGLVVNPEVPGSITGATRCSEYQWVWNGVHSALVRITEELIERKATA
jgi:hypothetical protein